MDDLLSPEFFKPQHKRKSARCIGKKAFGVFYVPPEQIEAIKANNTPADKIQESVLMASGHELQLQEMDRIRPYLDDRDWQLIDEGLNAGIGNLYQLMKNQYDNKKIK